MEVNDVSSAQAAGNRWRGATGSYAVTCTMTVYYVAPDSDDPSGGMRVIYRHVDILNRHGIAAAVLHCRRGFRCSWFANETAVVYAEGLITDSATDVIVFPEISIGRVPLIAPDV